jgi:hypothetical protein
MCSLVAHAAHLTGSGWIVGNTELSPVMSVLPVIHPKPASLQFRNGHRPWGEYEGLRTAMDIRSQDPRWGTSVSKVEAALAAGFTTMC